MLIRELGNCGNLDKLKRITNALDVAIRHETMVVIVLDKLVYGDNMTVINEVVKYDFSKDTLFVTDSKQCHTFPWWDIEKVNLIF